jgi:uncharacterized protein DUF6458
MRPVSIASSIFLIAVGAILRYAVTFDVKGVDIHVVGLILMIAGIAALALSLFYELLYSERKDRARAPEDYDRTRRLR